MCSSDLSDGHTYNHTDIPPPKLSWCVEQVFHKPMSESGRLPEDEMAMIFVNWKELIACNTKLLKYVCVCVCVCGFNTAPQSLYLSACHFSCVCW